MDINEKISLNAREIMKLEIEEAGGNEVFFRGIPNENGIVTQVFCSSYNQSHEKRRGFNS